MGISISYDESGNIYVTGISTSSWGSPLNPFSGNSDIFVARLNTNGELQWNTFLGGSGHDYGVANTFDGTGNIYVTGYTGSTWGNSINPYNLGGTFVARLMETEHCNGTLSWAAVVKT